MASALLQLNPDDRIGADDGLLHPYFAQLPKKLYELPDGKFCENFLTGCLTLICLCPHRNINFHRRRCLFVSGARS